MNLAAGISYELSYEYEHFLGGATDVLSIYVGSAPNANSMTQQVSTTGNFSSTSTQTRTDSFTVSTSGTYYVGIRGQQVAGAGHIILDNLSLTGSNGLNFHNLQVNSGSTASLNQNTAVSGNITTQNGGSLNLTTRNLTVEGNVNNAGTLSQQKSVGAGQTIDFVRLTNRAGNSVRYYGVQLSGAASSLGNTTVAVSGQQACGLGLGISVKRCYAITPATPASATVRLHFSEAERNGEPANSAPAWVWGGATWQAASSTANYTHSEGGVSCASAGGLGCWVQAVNVTSYGTFAIGEDPNNAPLTPMAIVQDAGSGQTLTNGVSTVTYGTTTVGSPLVRTFIISNAGMADLVLSNLGVTGDYEVATGFGSSTVTFGNSTSFAIRLTAVADGTQNGTVSFNTNVPTAPSFSFGVTGKVSGSGFEIYLPLIRR